MNLPKFLDFNQNMSMFSNSWLADIGFFQHEFDMGYHAFNNSREIGVLVCYLKEKFNLDVAVETGTDHGSTTAFFANYFTEVHTIEILPKNFYPASKALSKFKNVKCYLGSSDDVLKEILPSLKNQRVLFFLDGHFDSNLNAYWPLLNELREICKTHKDNCVIIIDDIKVPNRNDISFCSSSGKECSLEHINPDLNLVFSKYSFHFVIPYGTKMSAKLVIVPESNEPIANLIATAKPSF